MIPPKVLALIDLPKSLSLALTDMGYTVQVIPTLQRLPETLVPSQAVILCNSSLWKEKAKELEKINLSLKSTSNFWIVVAQEKETVKVPKNGPFDEYLHWPCSMPELQKRVQTGFQILTLQNKIEETCQKMKNLKDLDTGLTHEYLLDSILNHELQRAKRYQIPLSCLAVSLDVKKISLPDFEKFSKFFQKTIRETDYIFETENAQIFILMPHTERVNALGFTERIRKQISLESPLKASVSFGIVAYPNNSAENAKQWVKWSCQALEQARKRGGNQTSLYRESES